MKRLFTDTSVTIETRSDGKPTAVGYAAVFHDPKDEGSEYKLGRNIRERIAATAFNRALNESHDARALFNHDPNHLLGRVGAGTLRLSVDQRGLKYEIDLPDTQAGRDVAESIKRGDLKGSSFSFSIPPGGEEWREGKGEPSVRTIKDVNLFDVGPVTYPAYEATTTGLRNEGGDESERSLAEWRRHQQAEAEAVAIKLRLISIDSDVFA